MNLLSQLNIQVKLRARKIHFPKDLVKGNGVKAPGRGQGRSHVPDASGSVSREM